MMQTIDEADYDIEIRRQARNLDEAVEETGHEPIEVVPEVLDGHKWFDGEQLTGADYGAIVSDFSHYHGDVAEYTDPEVVTEAYDFDTVLKRMAFAEFEADVIRCLETNDYETY